MAETQWKARTRVVVVDGPYQGARGHLVRRDGTLRGQPGWLVKLDGRMLGSFVETRHLRAEPEEQG